MESSNPALMATSKSEEDWEAVREYFTRLYSTKTLPVVMILMERHRNFKASPRQYKEKISSWGLTTYKKRDKKLQLEIGDTTASDNPSSAVSSDGDTSDHIASADLSIPPGLYHTGQRRARVSRMPRLHHQHEADAQDPHLVYKEPVSTCTTTSPNPKASRYQTPPTQAVRTEYPNGDFFDASALDPGMAVLPVFIDSQDDFETMGVTPAAPNGSGQAEPDSGRPGDTDVQQSFGSSNKSSGTIDSNKPSEYDLVIGEYLEDLY